jgi:hypothetical protein
MSNERKERLVLDIRRLYAVELVVTIVVFVMTFATCSSMQALEDAPIITLDTHQDTFYNGKEQPLEALIKALTSNEGVPPLIITYFRSEEDLHADKNGSSVAPLEVGNYYVRIRRPAGKGYRAGDDITVEYYIQKAVITIYAEAKQEFVYDGRSKAVVFSVDQNVKLDVVYFHAATGEFLKGPPVERGVYRALILYTADEHYMGASKEIDLIIR